MIDVTVNGNPRTFPSATTIADLLLSLQLDGKKLAVERNEFVVPHAEHAHTLLQTGDRIEIVTLVGGG